MDKKDLSERDICSKFITPSILKAHWTQSQFREEVKLTDGRVAVRGKMAARAKNPDAKPHSAKLTLDSNQLEELRQKHGEDFENWWQERFGYSFDCLTQSEAWYLARSPDADHPRSPCCGAASRR